MKSTCSSERDATFAQMMLTLRTALDLTQAELARLLGVSRRAIGEWEAGNSAPKTDHLKQFIELAVRKQVFPAGQQAEEIRTLWKKARQKGLLDEEWLQALLAPMSQREALTVPSSGGEVCVDEPTLASAPPATARPAGGPRVDWGDALIVPSFYGREQEMEVLSTWMVQERCRVVSVLGMGGIGKSALAVRTMSHLAEQFEVVIFRSLRDALSCEALLDDCLRVLSPPSGPIPVSLEQRISFLLDYLSRRRTLLVLDNLESLLDEEELTGRFRSGFEGYERLLSRMAQTAHQSCLVLTSREKAAVLRPLESRSSPVRSLRLSGLDVSAGERLLADKDLKGTDEDKACLIERYVGNPLALRIVSEIIIFYGLALSPDGRLLASGSFFRGVMVWDVKTSTRLWVGRTHPTRIRSVAWSSDGRQLASGGDDGCVCVWDVVDGTLLKRLEAHCGGAVCIAWHPDGMWLASGCGSRESGELFVWDAQRGERVRTFGGLTHLVSAVTWSPNGDLLICGDSDGKLFWWNVSSQECVRQQAAHQGIVQSLKVSPDGNRLASCGDDGTIRIWNVQSGEFLRMLRRDRPYERLDITEIRGLNEAQKATLHLLGAIDRYSGE